MESQVFDLRERLGDTMKSLALRAHSKGLELACASIRDVPQRLVGDISRLRQIVVNLVGNAIKFTERGEVLLEVTLLEQQDNAVQLRFAVIDTGIGIPPDKLESVFRAFEQADSSTTRRYGGTGLGLAIASRLVSLMDGQIRVESTLGAGSRFFFDIRLPIDEGTAGSRPKYDVDGIAILVVDDNATNRRIIEVQLSAWGMRPLSSSSARQALALLNGLAAAGDPVPIVLCDDQMPEHDGYELAEWIRGQPALASTRLILMTSSQSQGMLHRRRGRCRSRGSS